MTRMVSQTLTSSSTVSGAGYAQLMTRPLLRSRCVSPVATLRTVAYAGECKTRTRPVCAEMGGTVSQSFGAEYSDTRREILGAGVDQDE
jgi:hypothetical protein